MQSEDDSRHNKLTACKPPKHVNHLVNQFSLERNMVRAIIVIALGSTGAALAHLVIGFAAPAGFVDFRNASFDTTLLAFGAAWLFSCMVTLPVAAIAWGPLHRYELDGFLSYSVVALLAFFLLNLLLGGTRTPGEWVLVASYPLPNAVLIRILELLFGKPLRSNSTLHTDARASPVLNQPPSARAGERGR
ncbi:MAG: hypothetical protein EPO20_20575 [Betaproteobacteria bacterium]|nr:MAG: hypothetical protein EPO20_20575 [Betaproteobacteria bacterium]